MVRSDQQRVRSLLAEAITILCKNCLAYKSEFCVEGLLGITLDNEEVFLVNIKENVSGGAAGAGPQMPMQPELQMMEQVSARMARPMPIKSPFIPSRGPFGQRTRGRGRGAFRINPTARKHTYKLPGRMGRGGRRGSTEPPPKRMSLGDNVIVNIHTNETPSTDTNGDKEPEFIVLKEEPSHESSDNEKDTSQHETAEESSVSDQKTAASTNPGDPLYQSLDFGDMLRQYEEPPSGSGDNVQHQAASDDTSQDDSERTEKQDVVVIKPEKDDSTSCAEESPVGMPPFTQAAMLTQGVSSQDSMMFGSPMDQSGIYVGGQSGPVFPGGPLPVPGQFMDPTSTMPGCSSWDQVPQVSLPSRLPGSSPSGSKRSSGGGRASAAAGSPSQRSSQGGSSQVNTISYSYFLHTRWRGSIYFTYYPSNWFIKLIRVLSSS